MPSITYDAQSFSIDSRRIWLVSAAIHYPRTPRQLWRSRIRAAKQAGCNCIETYVFWNVHEPQPGRFVFDGDADLRRFIEIVGEEGLHAIVRPGPYVCSEWDFGGLPPWLSTIEGIKLRQSHPAFLQATARYLDAVMKQIADLQVTSRKGGPIIAFQNENEWFCHHDAEGDAYLGEISRFLREAGCKVPVLNCNNLWQHVPGTIDCWNGWSHLFDHTRQLRIAQPDAPRFVTELWPGWFDAWGSPHEADKSAGDLLRTLAEVSSTGAQYNLYMFHGGTNFGFYGGRTVGAPDRFMTTSYDYDAPLREAGGRGTKYHAAKRIGVFLSQFADLMANLKPDEHHAVAAPGEQDVSVVQQTGAFGHVVFLTRTQAKKDRVVSLRTPDGRALPVHLGADTAAWVVLDANLDGVATLDLTNLRPWAFVGRRMLVLFGPAGTDALLSIDGALLHETVPTGVKPLVVQHQGLTVVIASDKQIDQAYLHDDGELFVGIDGFDENDEPIRGAGVSYTVVSPDGEVTGRKFKPATKPTSPKLKPWSVARIDEYPEGSAPRFASIDGPRSHEDCGVDFGYGWYALKLKRPRAGKIKLLVPEANDRLHLYLDGDYKGVLGAGMDATHEPFDLSLPDGESQLVMLSDNLGRFNYGPALGELKGVFGHLLNVKKLALGKPTVEVKPAADPFVLSGYVDHRRFGDRTPRTWFTYKVNHRRKTPIVLSISGDRPPSVLFVNDQPIGIDGAFNMLTRFVLKPDEHLKAGNNTITFAMHDDVLDGFTPTKAVDAYEGEPVSDKAEWRFARWQMPDDEAFAALPTKHKAGTPCWFRATFGEADTSQPLFLDLAGATKGQLYLNGHNLGRYWVATATGKKVPPQSRYYLPEPWLNEDGDNELTLFDEHGKPPRGSKLVHDPMGPFSDVP